jgi:hypothetical protein
MLFHYLPFKVVHKVTAAAATSRWFSIEHKVILFRMSGEGECWNLDSVMVMYDDNSTSMFMAHWLSHGSVTVFCNWVFLPWMFYLNHGAAHVAWVPECSECSECFWLCIFMPGLSASDSRLGDNLFALSLGFCGSNIAVCHNLCWSGVILVCCQFVDLDYTRVHIIYMRNLHVKSTNTMLGIGKVVTPRLSPMAPKINPYNG